MNTITTATIEGLRSGKTVAYDAIFLYFSKRVYVFIDMIIDSPSDAEELTQDVFVKLWQTRESVDPTKNIAPYIFVIAKNMAISFLRKKRTETHFLNDMRSTTGESSDQPDDMEGDYMDLLIRMVTSNLSNHDKHIFELSCQENLSNDQIAQRLDISKRTVENSLSKTKAHFRKLMSTQES